MVFQNLTQVFLQNVDKLKDRPCFQYKKANVWKTITWQEAEEKVRQIALGLEALGVKKGDMVAIFSATRVEWTLCDLAILSLGAVTVPIYQSNTAEQASYVLQNSDSRIVFVENKQLCDKIRSAVSKLSSLEKMVLIAGRAERDDKVLTLDQLQKMGEGGDKDSWRNGIEAIQPTDLATLVYTSGTTGPPKGAILTHGNFLAEIDACLRAFEIHQRDVCLLFLPLAHILARVMQFVQIFAGCTHAYAESIDKLVANIGEVRPHFFVSVPRIFEKIHEKILQQVEAGSPLKKAIFSWSLAIGRDMSLKRQSGKVVGPLLSLKGGVAFFLVFSKLKQRLGGRVRFVVSGGAPLSKEIAEFFHAAGILILEGYGLTETTAAINVATRRHYKFGTVGKTVQGVEEKIAEDGEILVRGPVVFQGYYKDPEATKQVFAEGKWFKTGDIGEIDSQGYLAITDRKKDIIVTAAGKNIAPQNIESLLKTVPFISQVLVYGDRQKYLTALVTLNKEAIEDLTRLQGVSLVNSHWTQHPKVFSLVKRAIDEKNKTLASFETIKRFAILENDFSQEAGELTPTLKVKRKFVTEKYRDILNQLYQD